MCVCVYIYIFGLHPIICEQPKKKSFRTLPKASNSFSADDPESSILIISLFNDKNPIKTRIFIYV